MANDKELKSIKVGKYIIRRDAYNLWIDKETKLNSKGEMNYVKVAGYSQNYEDLLMTFMDNRIRGKNMKDVESILRTIATAEAEAKKIVRAMVRDKLCDLDEKGESKK